MQKKVSALATLFLIGLSTNAMSYDPPIGIPDPTWGSIHPIDTATPALPADWSSEVAGFYFVAPSDANATDSNNTYGTPTTPRRSLPSNVQPGSQIVLSGTFNNRLSMTGLNCTEQAPCWIRGVNEAQAPVMAASFELRGGSYVFIENLDFNGGSDGGIFLSGMNTHHISIRSNKVRNRAWVGNTAAISTRPDRGGAMHDIVIHGNELHDLGDYQSTVDQDFQGFNPTLWDRDSSTSQYDIWFVDNRCYRISGDCAQVNSGPWQGSEQYLHHVYIGRNVASQNRQGGVWIKQASDVIVSQNIAYDMNGGGSGNAGHGFGGQYQKENIWFLFNEVYDSVYGFRQSDTSSAGDIYFIGNLVRDIRPAPGRTDYDPDNDWEQGAAFALWHGNSNRYIVDNTIHNVYDGITGIYNGRVDVYGNIVSQKDDHPDNHFFTLAHPARNDLVEMNSNIFIDQSSESYFTWWENAGIVGTLDEIRSVSAGRCSLCQSIIGSDSSDVFVNPTADINTRNFSLVTGSPAIGGNVRHPAYNTFQNRYGIDIYVDFKGTPRDATDPSIGAFEYTGDDRAARPLPPSNLN